MNLLYGHKFLIHVCVLSNGGKVWQLKAIYASPNSTIRRGIWDKLNEMQITEPWLVMGDFNCVAKWG